MKDCEDLCGRTIGEFVLRERIGAGGFGAVYRCEQPLLGREAVVKVLHQRLRRNDVIVQRFLREAQLASRLDHPYAAHVYAFGIEDDQLVWIAMEMVQGTTLAHWLRDRGPLPLDQLVPFFERVAEVVQTAHDRGIVHRDLKPSNVMVIERAGRLLPKLLDFGIAKLLDEAAATLPLSPLPARPSALSKGVTPNNADAGRIEAVNVETQTGTSPPPEERGLRLQLTGADATLGTLPYMSPEQLSNAITVGPSADLYALGVVAYEALTGRRPFHADTPADYKQQHGDAQVPPLGDGFSPALDRLFQRALARRPEDRWGSALELAAALRVASGLGDAAADLPKLDETIRDAWLAAAPQPLAESIAALDGARNAHQALDAAQELARTFVRYLFGVALAAHAHVRGDRDDSELLELIRTMRRSDLREDERGRLLRLLLRSRTSPRGVHPIPGMIDLVAPRADDGADRFDAILALYATSDCATTEDAVRGRLGRLIPELSQLLRDAAFVLDHVLVVPRDGSAERWTGLRRPVRAVASAGAARASDLVDHHPMLLDRHGRICIDLWPLMQVVAPTEGADPELFLFDGRGRHGARMVAAPAGFEHHDPGVWEWIAAHVIAEVETAPDASLDDQPPYLGLTPFSTGDAARFFGRERDTDALLNRLRQRPLQIVVGASGAGKSSFVHAGVIPGLPPSWRTATMRPGAAPLGTLASRLSAAGVATADLPPLLEASPAAVASLVAHAAASGIVVVVIDQLEELFTLCTSAAERLQFAAVIAQLAASVEAPIRVICTIRDDFLMQLEALAPLRSMLSPALVLLGNPSRDDLVRIVVEPARRAGYALSDPELAHDMVTAVADRPGALALLSFTASRLWELRDRRFRQLTRSAYDAMGGVGGALGQHAETTFDTLSASERRSAREIFRHLVTAEATRARVMASELRQRLAAPHADAVIDKLVAARLVVVSDTDGDSYVEIAHEALIAAWPRLQQWVREDVDGVRMRDQVRTAARQWLDRHRMRGLLWRDDALVDLERWLRRASPVALSDLETAFVEASRRQARRARWIRRAAVALAAAVAFAVIQHLATLQARTVKQLAEARVTQSAVEQGRHALLEGKHTEALIYLAEAERRGEHSPSLSFMLARAAQPFLAEQATLSSTSGRMWWATFSRDGRWIVTSDDKGTRLWDAATYQLLRTLPQDGGASDTAFSPDGNRLLTGGLDVDGGLKVWDAAAGTLVYSLTPKDPTLKAAYGAVEVSPDGTLIAALERRGRAMTRVWAAATGTLIAELPNVPAPSPSSRSMSFSHDGRWLATSGGDDAQVFDTRTWKRVLTLAGPQINDLSFDPVAPRLATATRLGDTSIWAIPTGERIHHLHETGAQVNHVAYSPDGSFLVTASRDGIERVWNTGTGTLQSELKNHRTSIDWAEFDPSSKLVVSTGSDGVVTISDVASGVPISVLEGARGNVWVVRFDPSSHRVIAASEDGTARIWDAGASYRRWTSPRIGETCGIDASLDGDQRFLAVDCETHETQVWDTANHHLLAELPRATPLDGRNPALAAVSTSGDRVAIAAGNRAAIYRLPGGQVERLVVHPAAVSAVAFARTGHDLVSGSVDGSVLVTRDGGEPFALAAFHDRVDALAFTHDGRVLAASADRRLRIYDPDRNAVLSEVDSLVHVRAFRLTANGQRMLMLSTLSVPEPLVLWDLEHVQVVAQLKGHLGQVFSGRFVGGDRQILTAGRDGVARLWDAMTGQLQKTFFGNAGFLLDAALDPDGSMVVTASNDGMLRFWDAGTERLLWTLQAHTSFVMGIQFQGTDLVTRSLTGEIARWNVSKQRPPQARLDAIVRCLPLRLKEDTGDLVQQPPC